MRLSDLLPPSDLLDAVQGVEDGLRRRRKLGAAGSIGVVLSATLQVTLLIRDQDLLESATSLGTALREHWQLFLPLIAGVFCCLLWTWATFWLRESKEPFRYTCSIGQFTPVSGEGTVSPSAERSMTWLSHDLKRLLNQRVKRFRFAADGEASASEQDAEQQDTASDAHVHVHGHYLVRHATSIARLELEVLPAVRTGPSGNPEALAEPPPGTAVPSEPDQALSRRRYDDLLERVYHSVVTEIYRQLQRDVARKIQLLPTRRLRTIARLNEAADYARSDTLHAYEQASNLYLEAASDIDPACRHMPHGRPWLLARLACCSWCTWRARLRARASHAIPTLANRDILWARALTGRATMLVFRRILAAMQGERVNTVFEAHPLALRVCQRLASLGPDVPGLTAARFDAEVALAFSQFALGSDRQARETLARAESRDPARARSNPVYLLAEGLIAKRLCTRIVQLERAVELAPRFEVAQARLAFERERAWRERPTLERGTAKLVLAEYDKLLKINPANLAGAANKGYVNWLLGQLEDAKDCFEQGKRYKQVRPTAFVAELDYGLARIHAEQGNLAKAYRHAASATVSLLAADPPPDISSYYFRPMTDAMVRRYEAYCKNFRDRMREQRADAKLDTAELVRLRDALRAFVLNDLGEAWYAWKHAGPLRRFDGRQRDPQRAFRRAAMADQRYAIPLYNLGCCTGGNASLKHFRLAAGLHPSWVVARLRLLHRTIVQARHEGNGRQPSRSPLPEVLQGIRSLLPFDCLWTPEGRLDESQLWTRASGVHLHWQSCLNVTQTQALALWAVWAVAAPGRPGQKDKAIRVLDQLRAIYASDPQLERCLLLVRSDDPAVVARGADRFFRRMLRTSECVRHRHEQIAVVHSRKPRAPLQTATLPQIPGFAPPRAT